MNLKNKWILITGASSGLGEAMAWEMANQYQVNLILVARREDKLTALKERILSSCKMEVECIKADLSSVADLKKVSDTCLNKEHFYGAVLNAGQTYLGKYTDHAIADQLRIIRLNIDGMLYLTDAFVTHFEASKNHGRLMVVSSLAAQVPAPYQAVYSGSKAFLTNFFHSLKHELRNRDFKLSVFSPGGIKTEMTSDAGFKDMESFLMPVDSAAKQAVRTFIRGQHNHIPGFGNRLGVLFLALIPTRIFSKIMGKKYLHSIEKNKKA